MKTRDILNLDYRNEESKRIIQEVLRQIKPLSRFSEESEIPFEYIEKAIVVMSKKYCMRVRDFVPDVWSNKNEIVWRATILDETELNIIGIVYGLSLYETFAKVAIQMYAKVKKGMKTRN